MQDAPTTPEPAAGPAPVTTRPPEVALGLRGLTKRFGQTTAVDHLDLDVPRGSFYGLVGPNGAGKTTTLSMATGLLRPDSGTAHVLGVDVWDDPVAAKSQIGILPDGLRLFDRLTGQQLVTYAGLLRGMDRQLVAERTAELLGGTGADRRPGQARHRLLGGHDQEDHPGLRPDPRPTPAGPRRALRGRRPGVRPDHPGHPRGLRGQRWHRGPLEPRDGPRRADLHRRGDHRRRRGARLWHPRRRASRREPRGPLPRPGRVAAPTVEGLAWLRTSSD